MRFLCLISLLIMTYLGCSSSLTNPPCQNCSTSEWVELNITPQQVVLDSENGSKPIQQFAVTGKRRDGSISGPLAASFSIASNLIGDIDANSGIFTASGEMGGSSDITAVVFSNDVQMSIMAHIIVNISRIIISSPAPMDAANKFNSTPTLNLSKSANIVYPLDGVVAPQNVFPFDIQWTNGSAGDLYRLSVVKTNYKFTVYIVNSGANFKFDYLPEKSLWANMTQTNGDEDAILSVDRWEMATDTVWSGNNIKMTFAKGSLLGSVYYWEILNSMQGRILRIDDGTNMAVNFMPNPPASPIDSKQCIGCHSISRDGRYMVGRLGGGPNVAGIFDLTADLTGNPAPSRYPINSSLPQFFLSSWSPDNKRIIVSEGLTLGLIDPINGNAVSALGLPSSPVSHANWSPDGKTIAYISDVDTADNIKTGNLTVMPVIGQDSFGSSNVIHVSMLVPGSTEDSYPSWSPDSKWIAFQNGKAAESDLQMSGAMYLSNQDGSIVIKLRNVSGKYDGSETPYIGNFSPFNTGGYYWLTFVSHRAYGNTSVGTAGRAAPRQQIWVSAIKNNPQAFSDPSYVPYWLPGQSTTQKNITAVWAPQACRKDNDVCTVGSQCCGGTCLGGLCKAGDVCRKEGDTCGGSGCCAGTRCEAMTNVCVNSVG